MHTESNSAPSPAGFSETAAPPEGTAPTENAAAIENFTPPENSTPAENAAPPLNLALDELEDEYGLNPPPEAIYEAFARWVESTGKEMYPHQAEALLGVVSGEHLIISTPTGSGKSLIAMQAIFTALATGRTAYYTAPLKALVSEKFFDLISLFGAQNVGMVTGDSSINASAPVICATAEILANLALRQGADVDCGIAVLDEFHFYADPQRGWAWQVPLLELTATQHILLSATLGDTTFLAKDLERRTHRPVSVISDAPRPVPLHYSWSTDPIGEVIQDLVSTHMAPVYVVHFSQREAVTQAQELLSMSLISKEQKAQIQAALGDFHFGAGFGKVLSKLLRAGIGVHHAGLLPRYRRLVERLAQSGLLSVICGTDTLGVGINVPIRTVLISALTKFDGKTSRHLTAREFHQIAGRAGRAGFDTVGYVVVQAPPHEIENARRLRKAGDDPEKRKRVQRVKPEEGKLQWSEKTFTQLRDKAPETLRSQLVCNHSIMLNLLQRPDPLAATIVFLTDNHAPKTERNPLIRTACEIYSSLRTAGVIVHKDRDWRRAHPDSPAIFLAKEVPSDFALNTPLSPFALSALDLLDMESPDYALDALSIIEAVQENPWPALYAQQKKARQNAFQKLKEERVEYTERMRILDEITWPAPLAELLNPALEIYAQSNPWVKEHTLTPKSVVREMVENALTFSEFISLYDLTRSEGVMLRYLTDTYRALRQVVPLSARTPELDEIITWLGNLVRAIDSSLLDEWEALANENAAGANSLENNAPENNAPENSAVLSTANSANSAQNGEELPFGADAAGNIHYTRNKHALRKAVRKELFQRIEALARDDLELLDSLDARDGWDYDRWADAIDAYFAEYDYLGTDTKARAGEFFQILEDPSLADLLQAGAEADQAATWLEEHAPGRLWLAMQILDDGVDEKAYALWAAIDLDASDTQGKPVVHIINLGER